jgi:hypothetical protein
MHTTKGRAGRRTPALRMAALAVSVLLFLCGAAVRADDAKTQNVEAGNLSFQAPAAWKSVTPGAMRQAQMRIEPVQGDDDPAELAVFVFEGGGGGVDANIDRWAKMFRDKDGNPPTPEVTKVKGKNCDVTRVELAGHYFPPSFPGRPAQPDKPSSRLLGAIVMSGDTGYFLRLVGPDKTVTSIKPGFDTLLTTIKIKGD